MKKTLVLCSVLALVAVVFAPSAGACGNKAVEVASKKATSCPMAGRRGCCAAKTAKYIKKCFSEDEAGNLTCRVSGEVYAQVQKNGDEVVYAVGDETYNCMYEAVSATWDEAYPDEANPFHKIRFDDDGNIACGPSGEAVLVKAKKNGDETIYVADGKDYDCAYKAFFDAASSCKKRCRGWWKEI